MSKLSLDTQLRDETEFRHEKNALSKTPQQDKVSCLMNINIRFLIIASSIGAVVLFISCLLLMMFLASLGNVLNTNQNQRNELATVAASEPPYASCEKFISQTTGIQIIARKNYDQYLVGGEFTFLVTTDSGKTWSEFMSFRYDDPFEPHCKNIKSLNSELIWVWTGWTLGLTQDGGATWHLWIPWDTWPNWRCCNYGLIREVDFKNSLAGCMTLNPLPDRNETSKLCTEDGGQTWKQ